MRTKLVLAGAIAAFVVPTLLIAAHSDILGCDGCHRVHHAEMLAGVPLWSGNEGAKVFAELYSSDTLDAVVGQPDGASKLCFSCHDGANPAYSWMNPDHVIDDLTTTHPISFVYDTALATLDGGLKDPGDPSGLGGTIDEDLLPDPDSKMQCNSCHDVHTSGIGQHQLRGMDYFPGPGGGNFCRMCHFK